MGTGSPAELTEHAPSRRVLSKRTFQAVRNRFGPDADTIGGIAAAGRERISGLPGVGVKVMSELDEVLDQLGLEWAPDLTPLITNRRWPNSTISNDAALKVCFDRAQRLVGQEASDPQDVIDWARSLERVLATETNLTLEDRYIVTKRYLSGATFDQVGKALGVTGAAVQRKTASLSPSAMEFRAVLIVCVVSSKEVEITERLNEGATPLMIASSPLLSEFAFAPSALTATMEELGFLG